MYNTCQQDVRSMISQQDVRSIISQQDLRQFNMPPRCTQCQRYTQYNMSTRCSAV